MIEDTNVKADPPGPGRERPLLSLVIVSFNTRELLRECLGSVRRHEPGAEVLVADNASRDGSPEMVRDAFPGVRLIAMGGNAGFAAANNAALDHATGSFVVLLNSDTVLRDDTLTRCALWLRERPGVGASHPRLVGTDGKPQDCLYPFYTLADFVRERFGQPLTVRPGAPAWLAGTALVLRREALDSVGGRLDDAFWMYWEDCDLGARLLKAGWQLEPFEGGEILHHGGASGGGHDDRRRADLHAWYTFGKHRWFAKHRPAWEAAGAWLVEALDVPRMAYRAAFRPSRRGDWEHARVVTRVLWQRLIGGAPATPGPGRPAAPADTPAALRS